MGSVVMFGALSVLLLVSLFGFAQLTGLHHVPLEQVIVVEKFPYSFAIARAERTKSCVTPARERLDVGHCWWNVRENAWFWCRPKLVNKYTGLPVPDAAVEQDFEHLYKDSFLGIAGVQFVRAPTGRCEHYEGWDIYR